MARPAQDLGAGTDDDVAVRPQFTRSGEVGHVPRNRLPEESMDPGTAYQIVHDELSLDGNARLNVANDMARFLMRDLQQTIEAFAKLDQPLPRIEDTSTFHH